MRKRVSVRALALALALMLAGCGSNASGNIPSSEISTTVDESVESNPIPSVVDETDSEEEAQKKAEEEAQKKAEEEAQKKAEEEAQKKAEEEAQKKAEEEAQKKAEEEAQKKAEEEAQKKAEEEARKKADSMSMLNYLTVVSQEINSSKNSRIYLESVYSSLINNTYPNAVDVRTEAYLEDLLDTLENYRMLSVKRDRLQYIYEQNRAKAMKEAIPNPIALLSAVQSGNYLKMAISVIYMAADSYTNYTKYTEETDLQYLKDGWELDDEEAKEVHNSRSQTFSYMIDMVRNNTLPGDYALNETSVNDFVSWKMNTNVTRRIEFLESNQDVYKAFGEYWLVLAQSYYENNDYNKCLEAVETYEAIGSRIFRKDYDYAKVLPLAIVSMRETGSDQKYIAFAEEHLPLIISNSDVSDWALNYFVAETYLDLYTKTNKKTYLQSAYDRQKSVVNYLIDEQKKLNEAFLEDIQEQPVDKNADKKQKKEVENYNKMIKEQRKTELPPISEPLYVNCQMLITIANELGISQSERNTIDKMLHENGAPLFLNRFIDAEVTINDTVTVDPALIDVEYDASELFIPAVYLSRDSIIRVKVTHEDTDEIFDDWILKEVNRKDKELEEYMAKYTSALAKKCKYKDGDTIEISIYKDSGALTPDATIKFKVVVVKGFLGIPDTTFQRVN